MALPRATAASGRPGLGHALRAGVVLLLVVGLWSGPSAAQEEIDDVFGGFGEANAVDGEAVPEAQRPGEGSIAGQIFDGETGQPIAGVTVILTWPDPGDGSEPTIEVQVTRSDGSFEFPSVPPASYAISFSKSGYRPATMTDFEVQPGQMNRADFPLPPIPTETAGEVLELDAFVVEASTVGEMMDAVELRMDSDLQLNIMSAEDFSKFAAGDVAEALKRVAGVNIVEGQFAIIRGLEDRYSATTYNGAIIPSPDPDRQSVQLDLFPSEIVSNLQVAKTFAPRLPSNASGGSIDIVTHEYPPEFELKLKAAAGVNSRALDRFLEFVPGSPVGRAVDPIDTIAQEYGATIGGRKELWGREFRFKGVFNWETDYDTAQGWRETLEPRRARVRFEGRPNEQVLASGSAPFGELSTTGGRFDETVSEFEKQLVGYGGLGADLDPGGNHRIDGSGFYTRKKQETVDLLENGYLKGFDYSIAERFADPDGGIPNPNIFRFDGGECNPVCATDGAWIANVRDTGSAARGPLYFTNFQQSTSFDVERTLLVGQLNGDHTFERLDDLHLSWAGNWAKTKQSQQSLGARIFYEPNALPDAFPSSPGDFPVRVEDLGPGQFAVSGGNVAASADDIEEVQWFGRADADYEAVLSESIAIALETGGWYETATRDVTAFFLEQSAVSVGGSTQFAILADTPLDLGRSILPALTAQPFGTYTRRNLNESTRDIWAWHFGSKATFWDQVDLLGGIRLENIRIESDNQAFAPEGTELRNDAPKIFPEAYLLFDRIDNPARTGEKSRPPPGFFYNDQLLGLDLPTDANGFVDIGWLNDPSNPLTFAEGQDQIRQAINGKIDERKILPAFGFAWRPLPGVTWRSSWARTVARPSFRELGYYASVEPGSDDLVVGNPKLQLSDVISYDSRIEWVFGELGDLVAFSGFYKKIEKPIESILIRNPLDLTSTQWRTFFNNPDDATLWGIEIEARKHLDFIGFDWGDYFSIGGNFTWIDAEVDRTEGELDRASAYYATSPLDTGTPQFTGLEKSRRLFGQPKWIANADINFDHPEWGTRLTLAFFAISDVLDAAGTASTLPSGLVRQLAFDRYLKSFHQLDLIVSQAWNPDFLRGGGLVFKFTAKNLTDSLRGREYDREQTSGTFTERSLRRGRDYKFSVSYAF